MQGKNSTRQGKRLTRNIVCRDCGFGFNKYLTPNEPMPKYCTDCDDKRFKQLYQKK